LRAVVVGVSKKTEKRKKRRRCPYDSSQGIEKRPSPRSAFHGNPPRGGLGRMNTERKLK